MASPPLQTAQACTDGAHCQCNAGTCLGSWLTHNSPLCHRHVGEPPVAWCLQVFPQLYLPIMTENNKRVMQPWREYLPSSGWFQHRTRVQRLNSHIVGRIRERWAARRKGLRTQAPDILDRIMAAMEASLPLVWHCRSREGPVACPAAAAGPLTLRSACMPTALKCPLAAGPAVPCPACNPVALRCSSPRLQQCHRAPILQPVLQCWGGCAIPGLQCAVRLLAEV